MFPTIWFDSILPQIQFSQYTLCFTGDSDGKESAYNAGFNPWVSKIPWRREGQPTQVSRLENSMDRGAWHAIICGVAESRTQLSN